MKEIVNRLHEKKQIELAKSILEAAGYKIREARGPEIEQMMDFIDSAYDKDYERVEQILVKHNASEDDNGEEGYFTTMSDDDIRATYQEIKRIAPDASLNNDELIDIVKDALYEQGDNRIEKVESFREAGLMTNNKGFVITTVSGKEYQFSLLGSF